MDGSRPMEPVMPFSTTFAPPTGHAGVAGTGLLQRLFQRGNLGAVEYRDFRHAELCGLTSQQFDMSAAGGQTRDSETLRMACDDIKALCADGSGRSKNYDGGVGDYAHCSFFVSS